MVTMDEDRISRWKCLCCGSKQKKVIEHFNSANKKIGYTLHCCNCGHIDNFALTAAAIDLMTRANTAKLGTSCTDCGLLERDLYTCPAVNCKYRKKFDKSEDKMEEPAAIKRSEEPTLQEAVKMVQPNPQDMIVKPIRS